MGSAQVVAARPRGRFGPRRVREALLFVAFVLPNAALIAVFTYRPLILNLWYSLLDWTLGSPSATFIGLGNYREFFSRDAGIMAHLAGLSLRHSSLA